MRRVKQISFATLILVGLVGCGDTFDESKKDDNKENTPQVKQEFKDYATNSGKWKKVETLFGADPAVPAELSVQHGTKKLFRTIYKSPKNAKIGAEGYPEGTMFVKELRSDDDGDLGKLTGSTTVMIKESKVWKFIKLTPDLKTVEAMGTQDGTNSVASVAGCIACHAQANESDDFTFPPSATVVDIEKGLEDFKSYKSWTLVEELRGKDPAGAIGDAHGNDVGLFRRIYKQQLTPKVNGQYPIGTMFLKELRVAKEDNKTIGEIAGAITVMVKRDSTFDGETSANNWEYFMVDKELSKVIKQGDSTSEATKGCFSCHTVAQSIAPKKDANDFIFPRSTKDNTPAPQPPSNNNDAVAKGKALFTDKGCVNCHGDNAQGGIGPRLNNQSSASLKSKLTARKNGTAGGDTMKGVASKLTESDIENLTQFIPTLN
jgi:cytochrome c553